MALPNIENVTSQILNESVQEQPVVNMKGNVTRPMLVADLLKAMREVNFSQLISEYGSMAGIRNEETTPMTKSSPTGTVDTGLMSDTTQQIA